MSPHNTISQLPTREMAGTTSKAAHVGPWGGLGAFSYDFLPDGKIVKIIVKSSECINSIQFGYIPPNSDMEVMSEVYGGDGGHSQEVIIEQGDEITEFGGTIDNYYNKTPVITSLYFITTRHKYHFGNQSGNSFSMPIKPDSTKFVGFFGSYGDYLNSIGGIPVPK